MAEGHTVLLIEDNRMDRELAVEAFENASIPCEVIIVASGEAAIDTLFGDDGEQNQDHFQLPDLILLDLKLPGISGIEVLKKTKSDTRTRKIPVIILTSSSELEDVASCYDHGANSYLIKPVTYKEFQSVVELINTYWFGLNVRVPEKEK